MLMKKMKQIATFLAVLIFMAAIVRLSIFVSNEKTKTWENNIQIAASSATTLGVLFACFQFAQNNRQHKDATNRASAEKAIELAKFFQANIIPRISQCTFILGAIGQDKYEKDERLQNANLRFTKEEMVHKFGVNAENEYDKMQDDIARILTIARDQYQKMANGSNAEKVFDFFDIPMKTRQFSEERSSLLNTLEWVAMMINTKVAEEEVIYQSLHQVLLRYIRLEYPTIALHNSEEKAEDQFYTNTILLYRRWEQKWEAAHAKSEREKEKQKRRNARHEKTRDKIVKKVPEL